MSNTRCKLCLCKDRPEVECPGEWEPGCDLGNNEKYVEVADTPLVDIKKIIGDRMNIPFRMGDMSEDDDGNPL
jgi:hypothetical protein